MVLPTPNSRSLSPIISPNAGRARLTWSGVLFCISSATTKTLLNVRPRMKPSGTTCPEFREGAERGDEWSRWGTSEQSGDGQVWGNNQIGGAASKCWWCWRFASVPSRRFVVTVACNALWRGVHTLTKFGLAGCDAHCGAGH
jgi:hypothetical protein